MFRKLSTKSLMGAVFLMLIFLGSGFLSACGGGGGNTTPPLPSNVGLTATFRAVDVSQLDSLTAIVHGDPSGQGVTWALSCPAGGTRCGGMSNVTSPSGVANTYHAPSNVSALETVTVTARLASAPSTSASIQLNVNPKPNLAKSPPPQNGNVGSFFSLDLSQYVQGGTTPFSWSITSGSLPVGLTLNSNTGVVSGTPTAVSMNATFRRSQQNSA